MLIEMKVLVKKNVYLLLDEEHKKGEKHLQDLLEKIDWYRFKPHLGESLLSTEGSKSSKSFRRTILADFPFMAKL